MNDYCTFGYFLITTLPKKFEGVKSDIHRKKLRTNVYTSMAFTDFRFVLDNAVLNSTQAVYCVLEVYPKGLRPGIIMVHSTTHPIPIVDTSTITIFTLHLPQFPTG